MLSAPLIILMDEEWYSTGYGVSYFIAPNPCGLSLNLVIISKTPTTIAGK